MNKNTNVVVPRTRRGLALGLVLLLGVAVLVVAMAMITVSGGFMSSSVDSKQRIKARMAAQSLTNMQMAYLAEQTSRLYGQSAKPPNVPMMVLPTGDSSKAGAIIEQIGGGGGNMPQQQITAGAFKGMMGMMMAFRVHTTGMSAGGAKSVLDGQIQLFQVPVFQFGVFYEGDLEICPGLNMDVGGPVHSNSSAFLRAPGGAGDAVTLQGPVTAVGTIYRWTMGDGGLRIRKNPDDPTAMQVFAPPAGLTNVMTPTATFSAYNGAVGLRAGAERLTLPIEGANPRELILPNTGTEGEGLSRQKFASKLKCDPKCPPNRWVNGESPLPAWISGPKVFFDRREQAWVKFWDFDVSKITTRDSVFYLADTVLTAQDKGTLKKTVINAFRIVNARFLPRNMAITSANPIYLVGDFNLANPAGTCRPLGMNNPPDSTKYCNAMIASDAFTLLSNEWLLHDFAHDKMNGTLERNFSDPNWTEVESAVWDPVTKRMEPTFKKEPTWGSTPVVTTPTIRINAAILTGNKPSNPAALPPNNVLNGTFENLYDGGWHNTIRFLERLNGVSPITNLWTSVTVVFRGSFVCMWSSQTPGLNLSPNKVIRPIDDAAQVGYYSPPQRRWSFDDRFRNLANMPPATPFLVTTPTYAFVDRR